MSDLFENRKICMLVKEIGLLDEDIEQIKLEMDQKSYQNELATSEYLPIMPLKIYEIEPGDESDRIDKKSSIFTQNFQL